MADNNTLCNEIKNKCWQIKEEWLNYKSAKIESMSITDKADMHKSIREITGQKT